MHSECISGHFWLRSGNKVSRHPSVLEVFGAQKPSQTVLNAQHGENLIDAADSERRYDFDTPAMIPEQRWAADCNMRTGLLSARFT